MIENYKKIVESVWFGCEVLQDFTAKQSEEFGELNSPSNNPGLLPKQVPEPRIFNKMR